MKIQSPFKRLSFILSLSVLLCLAIFTMTTIGKYLPWGQSSALKTANAFMTALSNADHIAAIGKLSPVAQKYVSDKDFNDPSARPISWQLETIDRYAVVTGSATFSDGVELPVEIRLRWLNNEWKIYGVEFGRFEDYFGKDPKTKPRLNFMFCCDSSGSFDKILGGGNGE